MYLRCRATTDPKSVHCFNIYLLKTSVFYINMFQNIVYFCDFKVDFSASLLQSHDPQKAFLIFLFAALKTFNIIIIIIMLKTAEYNFSVFLLLIESSKEQNLSEI